MKAIYCFAIACLCGLLGMPDATAQKTKGKKEYPEGGGVVTKSDLRATKVTNRGLFVYPKGKKIDAVEHTCKGHFVDSVFKKLTNIIGNGILTPEMKEVVKSVREHPKGNDRMFLVDYAFNGKGEIVAGRVKLAGEYKKYKREAKAIYRALSDLKIDVLALKKWSPYFQDFSESDVFKQVLSFDVWGKMGKMLLELYVDLEETDNK